MRSKLFDLIDIEAVSQVAVSLLLAGVDAESVVTEIGSIIDEMVDWSEIFQGAFGVAMERADGALATAIARLVVRVAVRQLKASKH